MTDDGRVVKAVSVIKDNWDTEELLLEELSVFQVSYTRLCPTVFLPQRPCYCQTV